jgi:hydroxymethylglutaryl-CoA synthase
VSNPESRHARPVAASLCRLTDARP